MASLRSIIGRNITHIADAEVILAVNCLLQRIGDILVIINRNISIRRTLRNLRRCKRGVFQVFINVIRTDHNRQAEVYDKRLVPIKGIIQIDCLAVRAALRLGERIVTIAILCTNLGHLRQIRLDSLRLASIVFHGVVD